MRLAVITAILASTVLIALALGPLLIALARGLEVLAGGLTLGRSPER